MDDFFSLYDNGTNNTSQISSQDEKQQSSSMSDDKAQKQFGASSGKYSEEIFSTKIVARSRTYFIDLKQSMYGKFLKISEKSNGRKNTIMIDAENIEEFLVAFTEIKNHL